MELERSLPCSQELAIGPYPGPDESSSHPLILLFFKTHNNIVTIFMGMNNNNGFGLDLLITPLHSLVITISYNNSH
jgi:hypothetical protein